MDRATVSTILDNNVRIVLDLDETVVIDPAKSLIDDYGADSLRIVELVFRTMQDLRVKVKRTELNRAKNIGELGDILHAHVLAATAGAA